MRCVPWLRATIRRCRLRGATGLTVAQRLGSSLRLWRAHLTDCFDSVFVFIVRCCSGDVQRAVVQIRRLRTGESPIPTVIGSSVVWILVLVSRVSPSFNLRVPPSSSCLCKRHHESLNMSLCHVLCRVSVLLRVQLLVTFVQAQAIVSPFNKTLENVLETISLMVRAALSWLRSCLAPFSGLVWFF